MLFVYGASFNPRFRQNSARRDIIHAVRMLSYLLPTSSAKTLLYQHVATARDQETERRKT